MTSLTQFLPQFNILLWKFSSIHKHRLYSETHVCISHPVQQLSTFFSIFSLVVILHFHNSQTESSSWLKAISFFSFWNCFYTQFSSVAQLCLDSLWPHGLQHVKPPCPSPTPGVYSNSSPLSQWCHPTISSSVVLFSSRLQSFPASGSFPMSQFFTSGGQSIGISALAPVLQMNIQNWFPLGWTGWIPLLPKDFLKNLLQYHSSKASILQCSAFFLVQLSHPYMTTGKTTPLTRWTFVSKVISLLFNMLSRLVITFLPRSKSILISWLQSQPAVI